MTIQDISDAILGQAGVLVLLLIILWSGLKRYWVFGSYYVEMQKELKEQLKKEEDNVKKAEIRLDRALGIAVKGTVLADQAVRQVEKSQ